jgi:hypothetical protein
MSYKSEKPRRESIRFFEERIKNHDRVTKVEKIEENYYCLILANSRPYRVFVTNIYTVGTADVIEIMSDYKVDGIVTMSIWNGYSLDAKMYGRKLGVGIFLLKELMGAINLEKPEFYYSYIDDDGRECFEGCK